MIQDTVRTWYVIYVYPIHGQDTRNTCLYKKGSKANHHKTFTKIVSLEIFLNSFQTCHSYVNAKLQQFPTAVKTLRWWSAPSSGPETTFTCATCRLQSFHDIHLEFHLVRHWRFLFLWQASHSSLMPYRVALKSASILFVITVKTIPKIKSCHFYSSGSHVCLLVVKDISRV